MEQKKYEPSTDCNRTRSQISSNLIVWFILMKIYQPQRGTEKERRETQSAIYNRYSSA
jgi:hypothetical protein